jgi:hypothetical protein
MGSLTIIALVAGTSALAYLLGIRRRRSTGRLGVAVAQATAVVGAGVVFFVANALLGMMAILALRASTGQFISIYVLNDVSLVFLSLFQGLVFRAWWDH